MSAAGATATARRELLVPGRSCWRTARADRFRAVQDAAEYFRLVRRAILAARESILILGWDISSSVDLEPGLEDGAPTRLGDLLDHVVRERPGLRCDILVWDYMAVYVLERDPLSSLRFRLAHRRLRFAFDDHYPLGASHHQKIVVVDDRLAFCGGIDLTGHRWDTTEHRVEEPLRTTLLGKPYEPYHEVQAMVDGPVAALLAELVRERWRRAGHRRLPRPASPGGPGLWPDDVPADLAGVEVAVSRTEPEFDGRAAVRECEQLFHDSIAAAERTIYIENQYFTSQRLMEALAARLREPRGPEIVVVVPRECCGWLEQKTMGALRDQGLALLRQADLHGRLRAYAPVASRERSVATFVHSKVMIVDDGLLRIGSANMSNRSLGLDTECDLAVESRGDRRVADGIRAVRDRLIAEHLGCPPAELAAAVRRLGSLRAALDELAPGRDRTLDVIEEPPGGVPAREEESTADAVRGALDPSEPAEISLAVDRLFPEVETRRARPWLGLLPAALVPLAWVGAHGLGILPASAGELSSLLAGLRPTPGLLAAGFTAFGVASFVFVPVRLLVLAAVVLLGPVRGGLLSLGASLASAAAGYAAGRLLGPRRLASLGGRRSYRLGRLMKRGVVTVALLRLLSAWPAASIHLLCGAFAVPPVTFLAGTLLEGAAEIAALGLVGGLLRLALLDAVPGTALRAALVAAGLGVLALRARTKLMRRQAGAPGKDRSEFG